MIELTDEMRMAAYRAAREWAAQHGHPYPDDRMVDVSLAAVLAIVERDHDVRLRERDQCLCGADLGHPWDSIPHRRGTPGCRGAS